MELKVFAVRDNKAEVFLQINYFRTTAEAVRAFGQATNDPKSDFYKHAEDYTLYELGSYTDHNAEFKMLASPRSLMSAQDASRAHAEYYASNKLESVLENSDQPMQAVL